MKKALATALVFVMALMPLAACNNTTGTTTGGTTVGGTTAPADTTAPAETTPADTTAAETTGGTSGGIELALITDSGTIDDKSFNQGSWEGMKKYADEHNITYQYYKPTAVNSAAYLEAINLAVQGGAKIVVTPGFLFEPAVYEAQTLYPDVRFILLDGEPHTEDYSTYRTDANVMPILYAEEQPGFMAGYAAVKDGFTKLGYMGGMAVPAVIRFGHGFVQGAEVAAKEMGLAAGTVDIKFNYTGDFNASPEKQAQAASWYQAGTEVIFAAGGGTGNSVMRAAEAAGEGKWVIGVDVDQSPESPTVISSAMKELGNSVYQAIESSYNNSWKGGETAIFDVHNDGVGLPMATSKWRTFDQAQYDELYAKIVDGTYIIDNNTEIQVTELPVELVTVEEFK